MHLTHDFDLFLVASLDESAIDTAESFIDYSDQQVEQKDEVDYVGEGKDNPVLPPVRILIRIVKIADGDKEGVLEVLGVRLDI